MKLNSFDAKDIVRIGTTKAARYEWQAGEIVEFIYNGTAWQIVDAGWATTTYYGFTKLATGATSTSESYAMTPKSLNNFALCCIAPFGVYDTKKNYAVGDYVRYDYRIYRCTSALASAAWSAASAHMEI